MAKLCLASAVLPAAVASGVDAEALFQVGVRRSTAGGVHDHEDAQAMPQFPGFPGLPGLPGMGGSPAPAPAGGLPFSIPGFGGSPAASAGGAGAGGLSIPGLPAGMPMPQISMEDMMKIANVVVEALRNASVVEALMDSLNTSTNIALDATSKMNERYAAFNRSIASAARKDVIPLAVNFMEGEMDAVKPPMHEYSKSMISLIRKLPLGKKALQAKMMIAMAEPMLFKGMDDLMQPMKNSIEAMGNESTLAFCKGALPIVYNASTATGFLQKMEVELKKGVAALPMIRMTPMGFMMPDVVPVMIQLGGKMIYGNQVALAHFEAMADQLNTTFRYALNEKLDCDIVIERSGAASKRLGFLAAMAALAAWLAL